MEMYVRWRIAVTLMAAFPAIINTAGSAGPLAAGEDGTSGRDSWPHPVHVYEEDNALITCVVRDVGNNTVIWKREDADTRRWRILTAGHDRVTPDKRIQILHDDGGDVWVLAIKDVKSNDSGVYACEVNSNPVVRTLHKLSVLSRNLQPPPTVLTDVDDATYATMREHNYTDCCVASNVSTGCLGFCNIQSILDGNTGQDPEHCEADFPAIVHCMADMRNHVPCCIDEGVPDICQDVCRGEYTMITDNIKTHFSCSAYTEQTLACIVEGIEILPSAPLDIEVLPLTDKSLNISWMPPFDNAHTVTKYVVNVTMLKSFDPSSIDTQSAETTNNSSQSVITPHSVQVKVNKEEQSIVIDGLTPLTMYEVTVIAKNVHGSSLPSYPVRSLTLIPGQSRQKAGKAPPNLPDVRGCCYEKGVTHTTCLDKLCGMNSTVVAAVTDLMICAPWAEQTFSCLANGIDHRPCCRARGLPELCQELCSGNVTELNFNYFRCVKYMGVYTNCLMQGYGVLPSRPTRLRLTNVDIDFAIVHWSEPSTLAETVHSYVLYYRYLEDSDYTIVKNVHPPHILTSLKSDSLYEVYVTAVNDHGAGEPSQRVVFDTLSKLREREVEDSVNDYNVTECCIAAGLSNVCLPVCTYDASMSKMKELATVCAEELPKLIRCGAGGRNHRGCCSRRGVPDTCLPLCAGVVLESVIVTATNCIPYIGNIVQCFEEGTGVLPGPVEELHAVHVTENDVTIRWEPPKDSNVTDYVIHYKKVDNTSMHETSLKLDNQKNTTSTTFTITGLETNGLYNIFVVSRNTHGTSLPSSVLLVKATATNVTGKGIAGVTSPPHSLAVVVHSATYVTISWQPPEFSLPSEQITYKLFYKSGSENQFTMFETSVTTYILKNLTPNTQYIIYVIALSKKGASLPSETLIAWTDPAYPAFVEPPTVHPINLVVEGSSMTILCIAMGTPMPTISLYISGRLVRQEVTRHMVTVIYNVTRDMDHISCYADNGFGTPMEARRRIVISHMPHLTASGITMAAHGDTVSLECIVDAHPEPKMMFWRDYSSRKPVIRGPKYDVTTRRVQDEGDKWIMTLTIKQISDEDGGDYYCHAENAFGNATQPVSVRIRNVAAVNNVTQCCMEHNVSSTCMDACSFYLDMDAVIDKPQCINDFDKLMRCAADGSDHRSCCANAGVERGCLDWCRGEPLFLQDNKFCLVSYTKTIMSCFREGRDKLPGPPQNVRVEHRDLHSVIIHWDIPVKNPHTVEMYRVFWRQSGVRTIPQKNDTKVTSLIVSGLKEGVVYECVVKAGNSMGTSHLTDPLKFTTDDKYITSSASLGDEHSQIGVAVGILLALVLVAGIVVAAVWFIRTRNLLGLKSNGNVAFENPSYLREVNMDHMQISQPGDVSTLANGNGSMANGTSTQHQQPAGWKHEPLHVPASTEVPPSLYEELKLGHDGVGFKRLKP